MWIEGWIIFFRINSNLLCLCCKHSSTLLYCWFLINLFRRAALCVVTLSTHGRTHAQVAFEEEMDLRTRLRAVESEVTALVDLRNELTAELKRWQIKPVRRDFGGDGMTSEERIEAATRALVCIRWFLVLCRFGR